MQNTFSTESVFFTFWQLIYKWTFAIQPTGQVGAACKPEGHEVEGAISDWFSILKLCYSTTPHTVTPSSVPVLVPRADKELLPGFCATGPVSGFTGKETSPRRGVGQEKSTLPF